MDLNKICTSDIFFLNLFNLGPCEDDPKYAESCPKWATDFAGKGCSVYESFMSKHCKKTCNIETCGGGKFYLLSYVQK